jgi:hypothetical protein
LAGFSLGLVADMRHQPRLLLGASLILETGIEPAFANLGGEHE